jgi:hypothetical protein
MALFQAYLTFDIASFLFIGLIALPKLMEFYYE